MIALSPVDLAIIGGYFAVILATGMFLARRRGTDTVDYLLAGRSLTTPLFVMTLVSTWYGGILGVGEFSYLYGISNWVVQGVPYYVFAAIFAFLLAGRIRASNLLSIPDKLEESYGKPTAVLGAGLTFLLMTPAPYILMLGVLLQLVTGWSLPVCLVVGTVAATVYLFAGGFRADVVTDVVEFVLMFAGFAIILPYAFSTFGGLDILRAHLPPMHLTWDGGNGVQFVLVWFFIALWTLVDPAFHQRCYAARTPKIARTGILLSILFWLVFDAMTATAGLYARAILPELQQPVMAYPLLAEAILPVGAKGIFYVGMLATIMSTLNSLAFISATTLGRDIVWRLRRERSLRSETLLTQIGLVVTALLAVLLAASIPSVIKLWYTIGTTIVPGLLIPLVASYFERLRVGRGYAFVAMIGGWLVSTGWLVAGWSRQIAVSAHYPLGIEPIYPGLVVSTLVWLLGLRKSRREVEQLRKA